MDYDEALIDAAFEADLAGVRKALARGAAVDARDGHDETALLYATNAIYPEMVKLLLEKGADPNAVNDKGTTTLARTIGGMPMSPHPAFKRDQSPYEALRCEIIDLLLDAGAEVNAPSTGGASALHNAARKGYGQVIRLLIKRGADRSALAWKDEFVKGRGVTPREVAEHSDHTDLLTLFG